MSELLERVADGGGRIEDRGAEVPGWVTVGRLARGIADRVSGLLDGLRFPRLPRLSMSAVLAGVLACSSAYANPGNVADSGVTDAESSNVPDASETEASCGVLTPLHGVCFVGDLPQAQAAFKQAGVEAGWVCTLVDVDWEDPSSGGDGHPIVPDFDEIDWERAHYDEANFYSRPEFQAAQKKLESHGDVGLTVFLPAREVVYCVSPRDH